MRPSVSVSRVPCGTGSLPSRRHNVTATPAAGSPRVVSRTCVEIVGRLELGMLKIRVGTLTFTARLEENAAPKTVAVIRKMLPLKSKIVHCRWSGESTWIPMGERKLGDRKSTRLNSSHTVISYAVFCLKKKKTHTQRDY